MTTVAYLDEPLLGSTDAPSSMGRYALCRALGSGASGTVYAAYDPEAEREVALNLMVSLRSRGASQRAELVAEARRWAAIDHPNVAPVLEVGTYADPRDGSGRRSGVYVARALVPGIDLQRWLDTLPANVDTATSHLVLDLFIAAGRGLAAAHSAGLVHRDFRPAYVIVGYDGRARLVDFGSPDAVPLIAFEDDAPRYPAPELRLGAPADARSDQYSFCAALGDALARVSGGRVSRRVRDVLTRGMAERPEERWPSMDELLDALRRQGSGLFRRMAAALGVGPTIARARYFAEPAARPARASG